jgi:hypothetical protein
VAVTREKAQVPAGWAGAAPWPARAARAWEGRDLEILARRGRGGACARSRRQHTSSVLLVGRDVQGPPSPCCWQSGACGGPLPRAADGVWRAFDPPPVLLVGWAVQRGPSPPAAVWVWRAEGPHPVLLVWRGVWWAPTPCCW